MPLKATQERCTMSYLRIAAAAMLAAAVTFHVPAAKAQVYTGQITGLIQDQGDAVVAGAAIKAINKQTGVAFSTISGGDGMYRLLSLPPGEYSVNVSAPGFEQSFQESVTLRVADVL